MANVDLSALKKRIEADEVISVINECHWLQTTFPIKQKKKLGEAYTQPLIYKRSSASTAGATGAALTLKPAKPFKAVKAEIKSFQHVIEERVTIDDLSQTETDDQAYNVFKKDHFVPSLLSFKNKQEMLLLNGSLCGVIESVTQVTLNAKYDLVISERFWSDAIWAGAQDSELVDVFVAAGTDAGLDCDVTAIDFKARKITVEGTFTAAPNANGTIHWAGMKGVVKPSLRDSLVAATDLYGVSGAIYQSLKAGEHVIASSGKLNFAEATVAAAMCSLKGLAGEELLLIVNPGTLQSMANELASKIDYNDVKESAKGTMGFKTISYTLASGFTITIVAHPFMFRGEAQVHAKASLARFGSSDVRMGDTGADGLYPIPGTNLVGYRFYADNVMGNLGFFKSVLIRNNDGKVI